VSSADDTPVSDREAADLFAPLRDFARVGLAVSGGADSTALLHLFVKARTVDPRLPEAVVLGVDHGLRATAAAEIAEVAGKARRLGLSHRTLVWDGPKPSGDLQAAARRARYRLMGDAMADLGLEALVLAHHADDQAETFVMRLARGSGVVGLAGMAPIDVVDGVRLVRPFLALPKRRLVATLEAAGETWVEDPSNADPRFERARIRAALPGLSAIGLTRDRLTATARAMARASLALDGLCDALVRAALVDHAAGFSSLDLAAFRAAPEEVRLRLLSRTILRFGGGAYGPRLGDLERLAAEIGDGARPVVRTLGRVRIEARRGRLWFAPEAGRIGEGCALAPGGATTWLDRRIRLSEAAPAPVTLGLLGQAGRLALGSATAGLGEGMRPSAAIAETATAIRVAGRLVAVAGTGWRPDGETFDWKGAIDGLDVRKTARSAG
jgi:tRNA(Ile)-lysidine synthase